MKNGVSLSASLNGRRPATSATSLFKRQQNDDLLLFHSSPFSRCRGEIRDWTSCFEEHTQIFPKSNSSTNEEDFCSRRPALPPPQQPTDDSAKITRRRHIVVVLHPFDKKKCILARTRLVLFVDISIHVAILAVEKLM